jgi:hypothetical protein
MHMGFLWRFFLLEQGQLLLGAELRKTYACSDTDLIPFSAITSHAYGFSSDLLAEVPED